MKTFKILFAVAIFAGISTSAVGQPGQSDNANINANASVLQQISVTGEQDLQFDLVSPGVDKTVDLDGGVSAGTAIGNEQVGRFLVSAGAGSNITLSYTSLPTTLSSDETGSSETMGISYTSAYGLTTDGSAANETIDATQGAETSIASFPDNDANGDNGIYVFLGGTVEPTTGQEAGTYSADITLTAEYN